MIKKFIYFFFASLINLNLYIIKKKYRSKFIYNENLSFGESFIFNILNYKSIINKKKKLIIFSNFEKKIANLFFSRDNIYKTFIIFPKFFPIYQLNNFLKKSFQKKKDIQPNYHNKIFKKKHISILNNILLNKYEQINSRIKLFENKKFVLIFIKHYNKNRNDIEGSYNRQTSDLTKVFSIIKFILKKKVKIIIMGDETDKSVNIIESHFKNKDLFFFKNLSPNQALIDQLFLNKYSQFGIGSDSGAWIMSFFFQKKLFLFDTCISSNNNLYKRYKNIFFMPKKVVYENKTVDQTYKICNKILNNKISYNVIEVSYEKIIKQIKKYL